MSEPEAPAQDSVAPDTGGLAMDLAMEEARSDPSLRADVAAFLRDQRSLIEVQRKHLDDHLKEQFRQLRLGTWEKRFGVLLRVATAVVGLALAGAVAVMIWGAAHSSGLVIEPFSVPPDLAARGLTGEVVAARMLDRIAEMQAKTPSTFAPRSFAGNWEARDIKLEIPETGVSLVELDNFLRAKLGSETRLSGEIVHMPPGLSLSARVGGGAVSATGPETDIDGAIQKLAEEVYRLGQPNSYAIWLLGRRRYAEAIAIFDGMIRSASPLERAIGYNGRASVLRNSVGFDAGLADFQRSAALDRHYWSSRGNLSNAEFYMGRHEASLRNRKIALSLLDGSDHGYARAEFIPVYRHLGQADIDEMLGAYRDAAQERRPVADIAIPGFPDGSIPLIDDLTGEHDTRAARQALAANAARRKEDVFSATSQVFLAFRMEDWQGVMTRGAAFRKSYGASPIIRLPIRTVLAPLTAEAQARLGDFSGAEATLATMPDHCYPCMRAYGAVAALRGQRERADWWFARAVNAAPSIPFAYHEWGKALLERGQPDAAIAQFTLSNQKGPHFADALEGWGEALMAKNQSHRAVAKFAEAEKYAPNWGRLHLKWGEALAFSGRRDEAQKHFARAAQLDLTPSEKAELTRLGYRHE